MDLEDQKELQNETNIETEVVKETASETSLDNLPRLEDMLKSEKEIKQAKKVEGLEQTTIKPLIEDITFARKTDKKKPLMKKRLKIITGVYLGVVAMLLTFVGVNVGTLIAINKQTTDSLNTMQAESQVVEVLRPEHVAPADPDVPPFMVSINEPRDYNDDKKELTFFDKITILFRNLFG